MNSFLLILISQVYFATCQDFHFPDGAYGWEAKSCLLRSGQRGSCTYIFHCPQVYFSPVYCGFINNFIPIVCCPNEPNRRLTLRGETKVEKNDSRESTAFECGISPPQNVRTKNNKNSRRHRRNVTGGKETNVGKYPWMALIGAIRSDNQTQWHCNGALIHPEWVLSAAHCFLQNFTYVVRLGEYNISSTTEGASHLDISVSDIIFNPEFEVENGYHDLALIKLENKIEMTSSTMPICLPTEDEINLIGRTVTLAGWGAEEFGGISSDVLRDAKIMIFDASVCDEGYATLVDYESLWPRGITNKNIICAGNEDGGVDSCQGDSGGPLMMQKGRKYTVIGIVAKGYGCGLEDFPGIYMAVKTYMKWIRKVIS